MFTGTFSSPTWEVGLEDDLVVDQSREACPGDRDGQPIAALSVGRVVGGDRDLELLRLVGDIEVGGPAFRGPAG